jgi:hypothetical protein
MTTTIEGTWPTTEELTTVLGLFGQTFDELERITWAVRPAEGDEHEHKTLEQVGALASFVAGVNYDLGQMREYVSELESARDAVPLTAGGR